MGAHSPTGTPGKMKPRVTARDAAGPASRLVLSVLLLLVILSSLYWISGGSEETLNGPSADPIDEQSAGLEDAFNDEVATPESSQQFTEESKDLQEVTEAKAEEEPKKPEEKVEEGGDSRKEEEEEKARVEEEKKRKEAEKNQEKELKKLYAEIQVKSTTPELLAALMKELLRNLKEIRAYAEEKENKQLAKHIKAAEVRSEAMLVLYEKDKSLGKDKEVVNTVVKLLEALYARGKEWRNGLILIDKLKQEVARAKEKMVSAVKERNQLDLAAAKALPKAINCFNLRLTVEHSTNVEIKRISHRREKRQAAKFKDPKLFHFALFSDNALATTAVVNSTVVNAKHPEKYVFHIVTDSMNRPAIEAWFALHPPGKAALQIKNVEDFTFLNATYCPVLKQLQTKNLKSFYFSQKNEGSKSGSTDEQMQAELASHANIKFKNPKYLSMLNHLRFYLPELFPTLDRVVFLDDDIVVQKDLSPLFSLPLNGNVNGAVFTCKAGSDFHRLYKYLNFSHPFIKENFDRDGCGWAYGMNVFDLQAWREKKLTEVYHKYQTMNEDRTLWQLGTLPPGLMTFYGLTEGLDPSWHVLGLGYDPDTKMEDAVGAAVIHYNGNWKPWLDTAMKQFKGLWTKYIDSADEIVQRCNIDLHSI